MKKIVLSLFIVGTLASTSMAQRVKTSDVPTAVKITLLKRYPAVAKVTWEKEKGNFEANWGGKSGEDMSVQFTPEGTFVEQVVAISLKDLPSSVREYVKQHYKGVKIAEAGKVNDAKGTLMYEAEVKGKDLMFDKNGSFLKID